MNIKNKRLEILAEFGHEHNKSLLIKVDQELLKYLSIAEDGTVSTQEFLKLLILQNKAESHTDDIDWINTIFDTPQAVTIK